MNTPNNSNFSEPEFSTLRKLLWPIHNYELKKFLPMGLMMFLILFNYTILRNSKDALVISAGGASVIPFLKGYVVLPASILFVLFYAKLLDILGKKGVFYTIVTSFLTFYGIFAFLIYPNKLWLHPSQEYVDSLKHSYPMVQHFISIFATWSYSLYYVLAELWGSSMIGLLFWQFANEITKTKEAMRFYAMFGLIANFSLILAGFCGKTFYTLSKSLAGQNDPWGYSIILISLSVMLSGAGIIYSYYWIHKNVLSVQAVAQSSENLQVEAPKPKKKGPKLSVKDSLKLILTSKYLGMITLLVVCYGSAINLIEVLWKNQVNKQFPLPNDYNNFMGNLSIFTGVFTIFAILFTKGLVAKFGWFRGAVVTPIMVLITGGLFFGFMFFGSVLDPVAAILGSTSLMMAVWIGLIQNVLSKGVKYGLFDPTKEMAYIPLDENSKTKGKAAVDVIGGRLGKASGGYVSSILMMVTSGTLMDIAPILAIVVFIIAGVWIYAVGVLNRLYQAQIQIDTKDVVMQQEIKYAEKEKAAPLKLVDG